MWPFGRAKRTYIRMQNLAARGSEWVTRVRYDRSGQPYGYDDALFARPLFPDGETDRPEYFWTLQSGPAVDFTRKRAAPVHQSATAAAGEVSVQAL